MTEKNDIKSVTISDLKKMGKQRRFGIIAGQVQEVDVVLPYTAKLLSQIRTIKIGPVLVARKLKQRKTSLQLTGQGYKK